MKFKNHFNAVPEAGEINNKPSMTLPDQTLSINEILNRYGTGRTLPASKVPVYHDEDSGLPDLSRMDRIEREEAIKNVREELEGLAGKLRTEEEARKTAEQEELKQYQKQKAEQAERERLQELLNNRQSNPIP